MHVNGGSRTLLLIPGINETDEHIALRLAAYLLFWDHEPIVDASLKHPALADQEFLPDLMAVDQTGAITLWVECGSLPMHKLDKLLKRLRPNSLKAAPGIRIVSLKATEREAARLRQDVSDQLTGGDRLEILAWPAGSLAEWMGTLQEKTEVYGEAGGLLINAVVNGQPLVVELQKA